MMEQKKISDKEEYIKWFSEISNNDVSSAGGKGASLGEMYNAGFPVPPGFVITAQGFDYFMKSTGIKDKIKAIVETIEMENTQELTKRSKEIRQLIENQELPEDLKQEILEAYRILSSEKIQTRGISSDALNILKNSHEPAFVAIRSSATTEDLAEASFAGQQESFLNIKGEARLIEYVKKCFSSLFTARAIYYRNKQGFGATDALLSVVIMKMVDSEKSGVMFSRSPMGDKDEITIESVYGLGEGIVSGQINPDHYIVTRDLKIKSIKLSEKKIAIVRTGSGNNETVKLTPERSKMQVMSNGQIIEAANFAMRLEEHYKKPQDIEFAIEANKLYIVQSRPITTLNKEIKKVGTISGKILLEGQGSSPGIGVGIVKMIRTMADLPKIKKGDILVTEMTNPDMVVAMEKSVAIITDEGGMTSHAAIVSREMGIPCFSGDTIVLTNKGFMQLSEVNEKILQGVSLHTLSFNLNDLKVEWKKILNTNKRISNTFTISVSKNGKIEWNTINTTPEHKFLTINNRSLDYKEIKHIIERDGIVYIAKKIPLLNIMNGIEGNKAYICGAVFSDGYLRIQKDGTSSTVFVQKNTPNKISFINEVCQNFENVFDYKLRLVNPCYYYCYSKKITEELMNIYSNLNKIVLSSPQESLIKYLASVIDGDGNLIKRGKVIKVSIDAKDVNLLHSLVISCMRIGLNYRVKKENNQFRFYITSNLDKLKLYLKRVITDNSIKSTGDTYFSAKHLFSGIPISGRKGIKSFVKNNCLLSEREIINKIIPYVDKEDNDFLTKLTNSDIGAMRVKKISENKPEEVFNIEVEDNNNYVVFTKFYTPIIVKNCVVGTDKATKLLKEGMKVTVDGTNGKIYEGAVAETHFTEIKKALQTSKIKLKVIVDLPESAERAAQTGIDSVGLTRVEGIIAHSEKHPLQFEKEGKFEEYSEAIRKGIEEIAMHFDNQWIRTSDIRTDEYSSLKGAPEREINPMLGLHGIRFSLKHPKLFEAELLAIKKVAEKFPKKKFGVMFPQVILIEEVRQAKEFFELYRTSNMEFGIMIETPAAVQIIDDICKEGIDFISFGTNDLTQFTLAIDRGEEDVQFLYNELNPAIYSQLKRVINVCRQYKVYTSICGQAGSKKEMAEFLFKQGINSISVNSDAAYDISKLIVELEEQRSKEIANRKHLQNNKKQTNAFCLEEGKNNKNINKFYQASKFHNNEPEIIIEKQTEDKSPVKVREYNEFFENNYIEKNEESTRLLNKENIKIPAELENEENTVEIEDNEIDSENKEGHNNNQENDNNQKDNTKEEKIQEISQESNEGGGNYEKVGEYPEDNGELAKRQYNMFEEEYGSN